MDIRFPIRWSQAWRSLTIYMSLAILVPLLIFVGIDVIRTKTFGHLTPIEIGIGILVIIAFSCVFSLGMTLLMRLMAVRLTDDFIEGRNYWGLKKKIPLTDITELTRFNQAGMPAIVVSSTRHGQIYILTHTENLSDLLGILVTYLPAQKNT